MLGEAEHDGLLGQPVDDKDEGDSSKPTGLALDIVNALKQTKSLGGAEIARN